MIATEIKTEEDYENALKRLEVIFDCPKNTPQAHELVALADLIIKYEDQLYPEFLSSTK